MKDKAEIEKLKAELAALRKKASEEESRRLRKEKEKAAQENEAVTKLRKETETLKVGMLLICFGVCMYVVYHVFMCKHFPNEVNMLWFAFKHQFVVMNVWACTSICMYVCM